MPRGAAARVFIASNDTIWAIESDGQARRLFEAPEDSRILTIDSAPGGQRVAALLQTTSQAAGNIELVVLDQDGENAIRISEFAIGGATPSPTAGRGSNLIDWSPQGGRLLVAFRDGRIFDVHPDEDTAPTLLNIAVDGKHIVGPSWSPTGEAIGFVAVSDDSRERSLHLFAPQDGSISDVVLPQDGRFIVDFTWMPDGVSLLFTEGGELGGAVTGIDLWHVDADGENRALLASAGTVAPVAQISNMRPSPDGRSVAYAVRVPGDGAARVDSVWVRDIESGQGFRISLPSVNTLEDLWWTNQGLIVSVTTDGTGSLRQPMLALLQVTRDGAVSAIWAAPIGTPAAAATPVATPSAS
jgi:dipeptidyl aminopeptidase/acylaminoacyl peptidase